jgi:two-component system, NtrC family, C4-dicarboxylate transport response regulator DctD
MLGASREGGRPVITLFVLDDDPEQAELMAQALTGRGRRVRAFSDPIRALAALSLDGADLLIADLSMPWIDGKDVVASSRIRKPELKIFLVSGYPRGAEIAAEEGVPFFAKPIDLNKLRAAVDAALQVEAAPALA